MRGRRLGAGTPARPVKRVRAGAHRRHRPEGPGLPLARRPQRGGLPPRRRGRARTVGGTGPRPPAAAGAGPAAAVRLRLDRGAAAAAAQPLRHRGDRGGPAAGSGRAVPGRRGTARCRLPLGHRQPRREGARARRLPGGHGRVPRPGPAPAGGRHRGRLRHLLPRRCRAMGRLHHRTDPVRAGHPPPAHLARPRLRPAQRGRHRSRQPRPLPCPPPGMGRRLPGRPPLRPGALLGPAPGRPTAGEPLRPLHRTGQVHGRPVRADPRPGAGGPPRGRRPAGRGVDGPAGHERRRLQPGGPRRADGPAADRPPGTARGGVRSGAGAPLRKPLPGVRPDHQTAGLPAPAARVGDLLCFANTAGYCMDFSATWAERRPPAIKVAAYQHEGRWHWSLDDHYWPTASAGDIA